MSFLGACADCCKAYLCYIFGGACCIDKVGCEHHTAAACTTNFTGGEGILTGSGGNNNQLGTGGTTGGTTGGSNTGGNNNTPDYPGPLGVDLDGDGIPDTHVGPGTGRQGTVFQGNGISCADVSGCCCPTELNEMPEGQVNSAGETGGWKWPYEPKNVCVGMCPDLTHLFLGVGNLCAGSGGCQCLYETIFPGIHTVAVQISGAEVLYYWNNTTNNSVQFLYTDFRILNGVHQLRQVTPSYWVTNNLGTNISPIQVVCVFSPVSGVTKSGDIAARFYVNGLPAKRWQDGTIYPVDQSTPIDITQANPSDVRLPASETGNFYCANLNLGVSDFCKQDDTFGNCFPLFNFSEASISGYQEGQPVYTQPPQSPGLNQLVAATITSSTNPLV